MLIYDLSKTIGFVESELLKDLLKTDVSHAT